MSEKYRVRRIPVVTHACGCISTDESERKPVFICKKHVESPEPKPEPS